MSPARRRIYVLDASVLLHDPSAISRFAEHDLFLPWSTIEALDPGRQQLAEFARNAREANRLLDELIDGVDARSDRGVALPPPASGRLHLDPPGPIGDLLDQATTLARSHDEKEVVVVTKDVNLRLRARIRGVPAEDYYSDHVVEDVNLLYSGTAAIPSALLEHLPDPDGPAAGEMLLPCAHTTPPWYANQCVYADDGHFEALVVGREDTGVRLTPARDFRSGAERVWGIHARNREQNFALNLLMDARLDFVTLLGNAGAGKTLLALAAGLAQTVEQQRYREIVVTRATVPVGDDIGFLPGTEEEKMAPWMGALQDNLEVLAETETGGEWGRAATRDVLQNRVKLRSLNFMRGRTFLGRFLIIDEAQNLTPKQMKTLVTRAGPGTKVVCLGNIAQIDTPYLTETTSGLAYVIDRFKDWPHSGHVTLLRGERSRLADYAAETL